MEKHVIIGDIHGRTAWRDIIEQNPGCHYVILGDYFDSFDVSAGVQLQNFHEICEFKSDQPDQVTLLHGNHDYIQYTHEQKCSGYQEPFAIPLIAALRDAKDLVQTAYSVESYLFTHAGVTQVWFSNHNLDQANPADSINALWLANPRAFYYDQDDNSGYGDSIIQGPLWVRPDSLSLCPLAGHTQVVGHTRCGSIQERWGNYFIDTDLLSYLVIDDDGPVVHERS